MPTLADAVLPLVRSRSDLHRWRAANEHGRQMHEAVDVLEAALHSEDPTVVLSVTQKAIASAISVILRADDSSGIIGDAVLRLLAVHVRAAVQAKPAASKLVAWMTAFQLDGKQDFFEIDPVAYAPALGDRGMALYRSKLAEVAATLPQEPKERHRWAEGHGHTHFVLEWNTRRLAVLDRDVEAVIRTHALDRKVAAWLEDTAEALEEIGEINLAIDWAAQAVDFGPGHQSAQAAEYWCKLLATHRPAELLAARLTVFRRWPSANSANRLHDVADASWPDHRDEVLTTLSAQPHDAVLFMLLSLKDVVAAWDLAHSLALKDNDTWDTLATAYEKIDPLAILPVLRALVDTDLTEADARRYRIAARRLARMRRLAAGTHEAHAVDEFVAHLRQAHYRRPRLQQEFDRAGLPSQS